MTTQEILDIVIKIIGTTIPGYLAYYCLYKLNIIHPNKNRADENKLILSMLALLNCFFGLMILNNNPNNPFFGNILIVFLVFFLLSVFIIPFVLPFLQDKFSDYLNFVRRKKGLGQIDSTPIYKEIFDTSGVVRVSIFTFNGECVVSGRTARVPDDNQFDYFAMEFMSNIEIPSNWTEKEIINTYKKAEDEAIGTFHTYIDIEKSLKFYIFKVN